MLKVSAALLYATACLAQSPFPVEKRPLGGVSVDTVRGMVGSGITADVATTDDGRRLATIRYAGSRQLVDLDGAKSQEWDEIGIFSRDDGERTTGPKLILSPDGSRLAYTAREGARFLLVVGKDTIEIEPDNYKRAGIFRFSPDGSQYAMIVNNARKGESWVIANGVKNGPYGRVSELTFSADGKHLAYIVHKSPFAARKDGMSVILDGKESSLYQGLHSLRLSADGQHSVYAAETMHKGAFGEGWRAIRDGKPVAGRYQSITALHMSSDGLHYAFIGRPTTDGANFNGAQAVVDGKPGKTYPYISELKLSPDGRRHAYAAHVSIGAGEVRNVYVTDGQESKDYPSVPAKDFVHFSPDSKTVAFDLIYHLLVNGQEFPAAGLSRGVSIRTGTTGPAIAYRTKGDDNIVRVFVNGKQSPNLMSADLDALVFTPDGTSAAYPALDIQSKPILIAGDKTFPLPDTHLAGFDVPDAPQKPIHWSGDGAHWALIAQDTMFVDNKRGPACRRAFLPTFDVEGRHFAYACKEQGVREVRERFAIYVDGKRTEVVDALFARQPGTWSFNADGKLQLLALLDNQVQLIQIQSAKEGLSAFGTGPAGSPQPNTAPAAVAGKAPTQSTPAPNTVDGEIKKARDALVKKIPKIFGGAK